MFTVKRKPVVAMSWYNHSMCGRFEIHSSIELIATLFQIDPVAFDLLPNYNVAPSQNVLIVIHDGKNRLVTSKWGFVPFWSKELKTGYNMINARAETIQTNRSYKRAFEKSRCLVVADGFFEWLKRGNTKVPYYTRLKSKTPMGLAGLYSNWTSPEGEIISTCAIITTDANELIAPVHSRMPVILPQDKFALWLNTEAHNKETLLPLLKPISSDELDSYRVTSRVNSFKYNNPDTIKPVDSGRPD